jgi:hypothetical protein
MSKLDRSILIAVAGVLSATLAASSAYAFNPQPDPPAKGLTFGNTLGQKGAGPSGRRGVSPGPCKTGSSCRVVTPPTEPDRQKARQ